MVLKIQKALHFIVTAVITRSRIANGISTHIYRQVPWEVCSKQCTCVLRVCIKAPQGLFYLTAKLHYVRQSSPVPLLSEVTNSQGAAGIWDISTSCRPFLPETNRPFNGKERWRKHCAVRVSEHARSQQNMQCILSTPLTEVGIVGCAWVIIGP